MIFLMKNRIDKRAIGLNTTSQINSTSIRKYLSEIGRKGGLKSRRALGRIEAQEMVLVREAKKAFVRYYHQCFWSFDPNYKIESKDLKWVGEQLLKNGDRKLWKLGSKLCR
jgi:hypothetical protein